jgi:membrane protease YdiL (CAAX protease family)
MSEPAIGGEPDSLPTEPEAVQPLEPAGVGPADEQELPSVMPVRRGHPLAAWLVIGAFIVLVPVLRQLRTPEDQKSNQGERVSLLVLTMQSKFFVGYNEFARMSDPTASKLLADQAAALNAGPLDHRLCYVVLVGELAGPDVAEAKLRELTAKIADSDHVQDKNVLHALGILERIYSDYLAGRMDAPSVNEQERASLRSTLGWFADLALTPREGNNPEARKSLTMSASAVFFVFMIVLVVGGLAALGGLVGLLVLMTLAISGSVRRGVMTGSGQGGIYAETFALWMLVFLLFGFAPLLVKVEGAELLVTGMATFASLIVLVWPVVRGGIPWKQVREDIGLTAGRQPALEPLLGPAGYAMSLPLLAVGVVLTIILITLQGAFGGVLGGAALPADEFSPAGFPAHPIIEFLAGPGWWGKVQVLFLGSIVAPIVEEIMFRGVLYRHMREATQGWVFFFSFLTSALVVSFVFAVIHPQGLVAVPALMSLAMGFTILREWRGSLISCMIAHGMNNALVMSLATFVFNI